MEVVAPLLDSASQSLTYYDPNKRANNTITTYTGDYEFEDKTIVSGNRKNEGFSCSLIAVSKR